MACETKNTEIEGVRLYCVQFPATQGAGLTFQLLKMFGPLLGKGMEVDMASFTEKLSEESAVDLIKKLFAYTKIKFTTDKEARDVDFDIDFAGNYMLMYKAALWVIQANSFFGKVDILSALNKALTPLLKEKFPKSSEDLMK